MRIRYFVLLCVLTQPAFSDTIQRIAFGSCAHQDKAQPVWSAVNAFDPDVFVFLGDNIYGDTEDMAVLKRKYQKLADKPGFQRLRQNARVLATWDDHDYGQNDAGVEYSQKEASRQIMLDFWGEPSESERRSRDSGLYTSVVLGEPGQRVQIILLDLRWNRTALAHVSPEIYNKALKPKKMGPYVPVPANADARLLGEAQWTWLEEQLREPAELRLIGTSIQLLAEFTGWESWANFPLERERFFQLLRETEADGVVLLSGDTHWSEFSAVNEVLDYPLWELTSSGLTEEWKGVSPNRHRVRQPYVGASFGAIEIDWDAPNPSITLRIVTESSDTFDKKNLFFKEIQRADNKLSHKRHESVMTGS